MKKIFLTIAMVLVAMTLVISGCQKQISESTKAVMTITYTGQKVDMNDLNMVVLVSGQKVDVSKISLQQLAELYHYSSESEPLDTNGFPAIFARIASLTSEEYDEYMKIWISISVQDMIDRKLISDDDRQEAIDYETKKRQWYNNKSLDLYGVKMNKIPLDKQFDIAQMEIDSYHSTGTITAAAACPSYGYPYVVSKDNTGTKSCVGIYGVSNPGTVDCDWEFAFNIGVVAYGKASSFSIKSDAVFALGGINYRRPTAPENTNHRRMLVGRNRINLAYSTYSAGLPAATAFSNDIRFRGLS